MGKKYSHLSVEDRVAMQIELSKGQSCRGIAALLSRSPSTISRELRRDRKSAAGEAVLAIDPMPSTAPVYDAAQARARGVQRRRACGRDRKLVAGTALYRRVHDLLVHRRWSPQQIAARLRAMHPTDPSRTVSHETIYASIYAYPRGSLKQDMIAVLRQRKPARGRRRTTLARGAVQVPEAQRIAHRPEEVGRRLLPGHWEGDFIKGAFNRSAVGTLVERKTRFVILCKMEDCGSDAALESFTRQMKKLPAFLRESLTYDRGSEMARHAELAARLNIDIWFADPYTPWQRGSNENTNGLLRQFMPKGTDLSTLSQTKLNDIAHLMNSRPRQTLGWKTPQEALDAELELFANNGALGG